MYRSKRIRRLSAWSATTSAILRAWRAGRLRPLSDINIRMISQGASLLNLSVVVAQEDLKQAVERLARRVLPQSRCGGVRGMKIALVGYGKMGRLIDQLAPEFGIEVGPKLDEYNNAELRRVHDGELPRRRCRDRVFHTAHGCRKRGAAGGAWRECGGRDDGLGEGHGPSSSGGGEATTSGWYGARTYSVGVQVFFRLVSEAARLLKDQPEYGAWAWEIHHDTKADAPSGTLLKLVER